MRTSWKTDFRSRDIPKITLVELTYPKAWTWSVPLCPLTYFLLVILLLYMYRRVQKNL